MNISAFLVNSVLGCTFASHTKNDFGIVKSRSLRKGWQTFNNQSGICPEFCGKQIMEVALKDSFWNADFANGHVKSGEHFSPLASM